MSGVLDLRGSSVEIIGVVGTDITITLTCTEEDGSPHVLTGYSFVAQVLINNVVLQTFTTGVTGGSNNILTVQLSDAQTTALGSISGCTWSLKATSGDQTNEWIAAPFSLFFPGTSSANAALGATVVVQNVSIDLSVLGHSGVATDHGGLTGLADDDHAQYALADGSRGAFDPSGTAATLLAATIVDQDDMASNSAALVPTQQSVKAYVDNQARRQYIRGAFPGTAAVTTSGVPIIFPRACTILNIAVAAEVAPTGAALILDFHKVGGATIFSTPGDRPTIAAGTTKDNTSVPNAPTLIAYDALIPMIDAVGSTVAGSNVSWVIEYVEDLV